MPLIFTEKNRKGAEKSGQILSNRLKMQYIYMETCQ